MPSRVRICVLCLCVAALPLPGPVLAAPPGPSPDADVAKGVVQVEQGDYDSALLTLDAAARRLAADAGRSRELARAYLYLGIAYLAKGHETSARVRFREALMQARDMELEPDQFAPRVIELFEKAREDVRAGSPAPAKKSRKGLWIGGAVVGAGAAGAFALRSGGGGPGTPGTPLTFGGLLGPDRGVVAEHALTAGAGGPCEARLTWTDGRTEVRMFVNDASTSIAVAETVNQSSTASLARWTCTQGTSYRIDLFLQPPLIDVTYQLQVSVP